MDSEPKEERAREIRRLTSALCVFRKIRPQPPLERRSRPLQITINGADACWNRAGLLAGLRRISLSACKQYHANPPRTSQSHFSQGFCTRCHAFRHATIPLQQFPPVQTRTTTMGRARSLSANLDIAYAVGILTGADDRDLAWAWSRDDHQKHTNAYLVEQSGRGILEEWEDEARGGESIWERALGKQRKTLNLNSLLRTYVTRRGWFNLRRRFAFFILVSQARRNATWPSMK